MLLEFVCLQRRYVCTASGQGGEPTPGGISHLVMFEVVRDQHRGTAHRQRAEARRPHEVERGHPVAAVVGQIRSSIEQQPVPADFLSCRDEDVC